MLKIMYIYLTYYGRESLLDRIIMGVQGSIMENLFNKIVYNGENIVYF